MTESERLLRAAGAVKVKARRHLVYVLGGERITLHRGNRPNVQEIQSVRRALRRAGKVGV